MVLESCVCCIAQGLPRSTRGAEPSVGRGGQEPDGASLPAHGGAGRPSSPLTACDTCISPDLFDAQGASGSDSSVLHAHS